MDDQTLQTAQQWQQQQQQQPQMQQEQPEQPQMQQQEQPQNYQQPTSVFGDQRATQSGVQQQQQQQQMNTQAQQQAARRANQPRITVNNQEVDFFPAPRGHASESLTRLSQRAREQERTQAQVGLPESAKPESVANARVVPMPAGGLHALALQLFPDDSDNQEAMDNHIFDLLTLNRDTLRDDSSSSANAMIRVPG